MEDRGERERELARRMFDMRLRRLQALWAMKAPPAPGYVLAGEVRLVAMAAWWLYPDEMGAVLAEAGLRSFRREMALCEECGVPNEGREGEPFCAACEASLVAEAAALTDEGPKKEA